MDEPRSSVEQSVFCYFILLLMTWPSDELVCPAGGGSVLLGRTFFCDFRLDEVFSHVA